MDDSYKIMFLKRNMQISDLIEQKDLHKARQYFRRVMKLMRTISNSLDGVHTLLVNFRASKITLPDIKKHLNTYYFNLEKQTIVRKNVLAFLLCVGT